MTNQQLNDREQPQFTKPARSPSGDRPTCSSDEGLQ